nr:disks large homolog 3 [Columba livia]
MEIKSKTSTTPSTLQLAMYNWSPPVADKSWFCLSLNMYVGLECLPPTCEAGILTLILALSINGVALRGLSCRGVPWKWPVADTPLREKPRPGAPAAALVPSETTQVCFSRDRLTAVPLLLLSRLGFNIVGGTDQQYLSNDSSIYVSRIKKDGAAYLDGRLQEGDKILAVNGKDLKDLRHKDAVEMFRNAGCDVSLRIQRRLQPQNGPVGHRGDGESGGLPLAAVLVPGLALAAAAVWILLRSDGSVCWQDMAEPRGPKTSAE